MYDVFFLQQLEASQSLSNMAKDEAQMAYDRALEASNISRSSHADLQELLEKINDFLLAEGAKPSDIRKVRSADTYDLFIYCSQKIFTKYDYWYSVVIQQFKFHMLKGLEWYRKIIKSYLLKG